MVKAADDLSPPEFRKWLEKWHKNELVRVRKTAEAQANDATEFVTAYLNGKLTQNQADGKWMEYLERWGDPQFEGSAKLEQMSDSQVIKLAERKRRERARETGL